jgi:hypothetical protein
MAGLGDFFKSAFGQTTGYACIALRSPLNGEFKERFFKYPEQADELLQLIRARGLTDDVYFCPQLLTDRKRVKANVELVQCIWADLDGCAPDKLLVSPTCSWETSPERYQAIWALPHPVDPEDGESTSRRVAYGHASEGSDRSGWDITQLLRVPGTRNFKYGSGPEAPTVKIVGWTDDIHSLEEFASYPQVEGYEYLDIPFPDFIFEKGEEILERNRFRINGASFTLFHREPEGDRSSALFRLEMYCLEAGLTMAETFQVCRDSACNKFADNHIRLWKDICRAYGRHKEQIRIATLPPGTEPALVTQQEKADILAHPSFVERYVEWAKTVGDAAWQYHEAGAFVMLSSCLAGSIRLPTRYGAVLPNLWVMILADTTLTRKSTAMDLATDILMEVDDSILMATDGSLEGLMTALQARAGRPSLFLRDEFTGLMDQMGKKDYMSGMKEFLTKLYDGRLQKRLLRKEEITIRDPRLIMFTGGIKSKMQRIVTAEDVESGFMPRFIFITAESDPARVKPLGPPEPVSTEGRDRILAELTRIKEAHDRTESVLFKDKVVGVRQVVTDAKMTEQAWARYNEVEQTLTHLGVEGGPELSETLVPMYVRLAVNILKAALLLAASRCLEGEVVVEEGDIIRAATYGDVWRRYAQDIIVNVGKGAVEHKIELVLRAIQKSKSIARARLMQTYHLTAREMDDIEKTLIGRALITKVAEGRATAYTSLLEEKELCQKELQSSVVDSTQSRCCTTCSTEACSPTSYRSSTASVMRRNSSTQSRLHDVSVHASTL